MSDTNDAANERLVRRWLERTGGPLAMSAEARTLLIRRLRARRRAARFCAPLPLAVYGIEGIILLAHEAHLAGLNLINAGLGVVAVILWQEAGRRIDREIAGTLPNRVSHGVAVSVRTMLGRAATGFAIVAVAIEGAFGVELYRIHAGWLAWTYSLVYLVACGLTVLGLSRVAARAAVAVDHSSLAVDERFRFREALRACAPLYLLGLLGPISSTTAAMSRLPGIWFFGPGVVALGWLLALATLNPPAKSQLPPLWGPS